MDNRHSIVGARHEGGVGQVVEGGDAELPDDGGIGDTIFGFKANWALDSWTQQSEAQFAWNHLQWLSSEAIDTIFCFQGKFGPGQLGQM